MRRRAVLLAAAGSVLSAPSLRRVRADTVGVTASEVKIGNTLPYSGPASAYGAQGRGHSGFWTMVNESGGIHGRAVNFMSLDDGYNPSKTIEQVRRLVEQDQVAFLLGTLGTAPNSAIRRYLNDRKIPHLFVASPADKWGDYKAFPWTIGLQPSGRTEAQVYAKYIMTRVEAPKIAVLFQNDDLGKDYLAGVQDVLGARYGDQVTAVSYEVTDPTIDSQIVTLRNSGANALLTAATPKAAAQAIRKVYDLDWKPLHCLANVAISVAAVIRPAGFERAVGIVSAGYRKDFTDPRWHDDPGMIEWHDYMQRYVPGADMADGNYLSAYMTSYAGRHVLTQCGDDLSRENIMRQATNLTDLTIPVLLPGIKVNTSPTNYHPIRQMHLQRWTGTSWELFGDLLQGADV